MAEGSDDGHAKNARLLFAHESTAKIGFQQQIQDHHGKGRYTAQRSCANLFTLLIYNFVS